MKYKHIFLLSLGHLVTDVNQGAIPVLLPFLIARHDLSYAAAAGIVFAANFSSSVVQPLFGYLADRFSRPWVIPAGLLLAGGGIALTGVVSGYWSIVLVTALSGIGIAAFHPEAARLANLAAGKDKGTVMSVFGTGGQLGFAIGPLLTTAVLIAFGLKGTLALIIPVTIVALVYSGMSSQFSVYRGNDKTDKTNETMGPDAWGPFGRLGLTIIVRSIIFYGLNTFLPLYWIKVLHQSEAAGGGALTVLFTAGVVGTLAGGRLADRFGCRRLILVSFSILTLLLPFLIILQDIHLLTFLLVPVGFVLFAPFSPMIVLGQRYLPNHIGFASGITIGLAVTVGGIAAPLLGRIADVYGLYSALVCIVFLPIIAACLTLTLRQQPEPLSIQGGGALKRKEG